MLEARDAQVKLEVVCPRIDGRCLLLQMVLVPSKQFAKVAWHG
jgi:hypothetical protein